jgi:hypothetical protein
METPPLYDEVLLLASTLVDSQGKAEQCWSVYEELRKVCECNSGSKNDHPFQWETLADFTLNDVEALNIYATALQLAEALQLTEYSASIQLAMTERYLQLNEQEHAFTFANAANESAKNTTDLELRKQISEVLLQICSRM